MEKIIVNQNTADQISVTGEPIKAETVNIFGIELKVNDLIPDGFIVTENRDKFGIYNLNKGTYSEADKIKFPPPIRMETEKTHEGYLTNFSIPVKL